MESGSNKSRDMAGQKCGVNLEGSEGPDERCVALIGGAEEPVVRGPLLGLLPGAFRRVIVGRVGRQPEQLDAMAVATKPRFAVVLEVMAGPVVEDEKQLSARALNELLEECEERVAVSPLKTGANR